MIIPEEQDCDVRVAVYRHTIDHGTAATVSELSDRLAIPESAVRESLERLAAARALVLQHDSREVLMAEPFSAVPTPFAVYISGQLYYGNCIWDALGIPAMIHTDARIECSCGCCGESLRLSVSGGTLAPVDGVVHFAIPASRWWRDIVHT